MPPDVREGGKLATVVQPVAAWFLGHSRRSHGAHWRRWAEWGAVVPVCRARPVRVSFSGARPPCPRPRRPSDQTAARVRQRSVLRESARGRHPRRRAGSPSCRRDRGKATGVWPFAWGKTLTRSLVKERWSSATGPSNSPKPPRRARSRWHRIPTSWVRRAAPSPSTCGRTPRVRGRRAPMPRGRRQVPRAAKGPRPYASRSRPIRDPSGRHARR